jgi:very-short-patch-repair endonuclease
MKRRFVPYTANLKLLARNLRKGRTLSEVLLWKILRARQMKGYQFHRQRPIDNYSVDFYCHELNLAIEIDGNSHDYRVGEDLQRQKELESFGIHFLRFEDIAVKKNATNAIMTIENWIERFEKRRTSP